MLLTLNCSADLQYLFRSVSFSDNVEFILKSVAVRHCSDSQDNDQPDYDSVASDEDTDQELPSGKGDRTKVSWHHIHTLKTLIPSLYAPLTSLSSTEPGLRPLRQPHYYARILGGEKRTLCFRSQDPAPHESQQQPER